MFAMLLGSFHDPHVDRISHAPTISLAPSQRLFHDWHRRLLPNARYVKCRCWRQTDWL